MVKILLALHRGPVSGRSQFFKKAVDPFLEENVGRQNRNALVVYETQFYPKVFFGGYNPRDVRGLVPIPNETSKESLQKALSTLESSMNRLLESSMDVGREVKSLPVYEGFEAKVVEINSQMPGKIRSIVEPQNSSVALVDMRLCRLHESARYSSRDDSSVALMVELIKMYANARQLASFDLLALAERQGQQDPDSVIVMPKGPGNAHLKKLFQRSGYEVELEQDRVTPSFIEQLISRLINHGMNECELKNTIEGQMVGFNPPEKRSEPPPPPGN